MTNYLIVNKKKRSNITDGRIRKSFKVGTCYYLLETIIFIKEKNSINTKFIENVTKRKVKTLSYEPKKV